MVAIQDLEPLDFGVGLCAVSGPVRFSDHLLPLLLALIVLIEFVLLGLSRADIGGSRLFLAHLAFLLLPLPL